MRNLLWIQGASCGGDSISLLNAEEPDFLPALKMLDINIAWHPSISTINGNAFKQVCDDFVSGKEELDLFIVEGAIPMGSDGSGKIFELFGESFYERVKKLAGVSKYTFGVGSCACTGGILTAENDFVKAIGLQWHRNKIGGALGENYRSKSGFPVINIPGCPAHPDWILETLFLVGRGKLSIKDLDYANRPSHFYNNLAHHACPRNEYYEFKASAKEFGQMGCLFEFLGCRGTECESDCNIRLWMGRTGSCTRGGYPCIACTSQTFPLPNCNYFKTETVGNIPKTLPRDVPKAWYIGISGLSKMATPERLKTNALSTYNKMSIKKDK